MTQVELISNSENIELYDNSLNEELTDLSLNTLEGDIITKEMSPSDPAPGQFEYLRNSKNGEFLIYAYKVKNRGTPEAIRNQAIKAGLAKSKEGIQITDRNAKPYDENHTFSAGEKVYVRIPEQEKENSDIDTMKCKGGEYFGIDVSQRNEEINLEEFKAWNREKRDSEKPDTRGISFVYIRATDGVTEDKKVGSHVNKIKEYNKDKTIKKNNEQISVGFYHRLNGQNATTQADAFVKTYNKYKDISGGHNLVPMLDLEGGRIKNTKKKDVRNKALTRLKKVEESTGIIPGIYVTTSIYKDYIGNDARFNKYLTRIAAYPGSSKTTQREQGIARRINHKEGTVNTGSQRNPNLVRPTMYQSSQEGTVGGAYAIITDGTGRYKKTYHDTDMDHTKDITKLFSENNKSK